MFKTLSTRTKSANIRRLCTSSSREVMDFDVLVVGGGPAGLSAAIRLKQLSSESGADLNVCVVEKSAEIGGHILSGNVFDPKALYELFPDPSGAPLTTPVTSDEFRLLSESGSLSLPIPSMLGNHGNFIISLSEMTRWMAEQAEGLGVEVYPGFGCSEVLYEDGKVVGVATSDLGIGKDGSKKESFERGMELRAKQTIFAEGARGSLSQEIMAKYNLRENCDPQSYGIGLKEIWEIDESKHSAGLVQHSVGWPLDTKTYGGSFLYHMDPNLVLIGYVIGLDYENPHLNPYEEFQRFKTHPHVKDQLEGGRCISYGARVINEGGLQSIPKLSFPGGMFVGCSAGFVNVARIKGTHTAMKSGMLAAESIFAEVKSERELSGKDLTGYEQSVKDSWIYSELNQIRNVKHYFKHGLYAGMVCGGLTMMLLKGREPWTLHSQKQDHEKTRPASEFKPIDYPKPDGKLTFDILSNLQRSGTIHEHDQPAHLKINPEIDQALVAASLKDYDGPEQRFCPAKVYEYVENAEGKVELKINAQNCLHCKTCDIKTPNNYIRWTVPEGGGGPSYSSM